MTGPLILIDTGAVLFVVACGSFLSLVLRAATVALKWERRALDWKVNAQLERIRARKAEATLKLPVSK